MPKPVQQRSKDPARPAPRKGGIENRIKAVEFDEDTGITVCVYGSSGTGKTTFWSSFPGPLLSIVCSGVTDSGELRSISREDRAKIQTIKIEKTSEIKEVVEYQRATGYYKSIVQDHATGLQDYVLKEILGLDELPAQLGWGVANQQTWGQVGLQTKENLRAILNLAGNRIIVAQERSFGAGEENELAIPTVGPALTPSIAGWLTFTCDYVVQTYKEQKVSTKTMTVGGKAQTVTTKLKGVDYKLRTGPDATYMTKFRLPRGTELPDSIVDPTYDKLMELINGGN